MEGKVWRPGPTVCRCCLSEGCYKDISTEYFWMGKKEVYADMLSDTFDLSIQYAPTGGPNSQSRLICEPCISRLRDATDFRRQIKECEQTFMEYLNPSTTVDIEIPVELPEKEHKIVSVKVEKPLSDDDDFGDTELLDDDDLDDEPLMNLASKVPKKESVDVTDLIDNAKAEKRKSTTKAKAAPKKAKVKEAKPSVSKAKPEKKKKAAEKASNETEILERLNAATLIEHTTIRPFLYQPPNFKCVYCFQTFPDIPSLLQHDTHSIPRRPHLIKNHLKRNLKADISDLKCRICGEGFPDLSDIRLHLDEVHKKLFYNANNGVIAYDLTLKDGLLECYKCNKTFNSFFLLNKHMNEHSNVVCETCGLGFVSKQRLKCHMTVHQNGVYKCGNCDAVLPTQFALRYHFLSRHAVEKKRFKCALCFERFSEHYTKMTHLREKHGISFNFTCSICKANFHTRKAFWKHKNKMHTQAFKCEICGKCFGENWVLKMHLKSHTGEKPFVCDICQKSYKQKKTLLKHKTLHETT
ncbi:gastrula zinc finger protein XlCGF26.1 isoform X14 [Pieris rapae]|uniref:gastrula zinc finger protein XlCGF26.1 isoform X14 n=1 Tax=Pieris rapae TaxID=64459 RepID=UPI001E28184C|nr:gastrula zinc finger protein XlCGF26.1 isoform X14 [Pieris rapae]